MLQRIYKSRNRTHQILCLIRLREASKVSQRVPERPRAIYKLSSYRRATICSKLLEKARFLQLVRTWKDKILQSSKMQEASTSRKIPAAKTVVSTGILRADMVTSQLTLAEFHPSSLITTLRARTHTIRTQNQCLRANYNKWLLVTQTPTKILSSKSGRRLKTQTEKAARPSKNATGLKRR